MSEKDKSFHAGHRERLRQKFLDGKLADYELLEALLGYAIPRRDVRPLARGLIKKFGCIHNIICAPIDQLIEFPGMGPNTAIFLKMLQALTHIDYSNQLMERPVFHNDKIMMNYFRNMLMGKTVEEMHVLYLDAQYCLLQDDLQSSGTVDATSFYPREIVKRALNLNAKYVVLVHNHPGSASCFSRDDIESTQSLDELLRRVDLCVYDHYLVSGGIVYSAKDMNLLKFNN